MSLIKFIAILSTLLALGSSQAWGADVTHAMTDLLFGLRYSPEKVRFEPATRSLAQHCPQLKGRTLWTYATWKGQESEYFVVSGFMEILPDSLNARSTIVEPDPAGVLVELRGTQCRISTPELFLSGKVGKSKKQLSAEPNEPAINGLVTDAMKQYAVAPKQGETIQSAVVQRHCPRPRAS